MTFYLTQYTQSIIISKCDQYKIISKVLYILFVILRLQRLVHILQLEHISAETSHISGAQWPHVASGYHIWQPNSIKYWEEKEL